MFDCTFQWAGSRQTAEGLSAEIPIVSRSTEGVKCVRVIFLLFNIATCTSSMSLSREVKLLLPLSVPSCACISFASGSRLGRCRSNCLARRYVVFSIVWHDVMSYFLGVAAIPHPPLKFVHRVRSCDLMLLLLYSPSLLLSS